MTTRKFTQILGANCLIIVTFNLLLLLPHLKSYLLSPGRRILVGIVLYSFQFLITRHLLRNQSGWLTQPSLYKSVLKGTAAFVAVMAVSTMLALFLDPASTLSTDTATLYRFLPLFLFNSIPGALMEEWLFRYFPVRFGQTYHFAFPQSYLYLFILILFPLLHIPAYLFQYEMDLRALGSIFLNGIFFLLVFLMTKNLVFTALFHAFGNNAFFPVQSTYNWTYFYAVVFSVMMLWAFTNNRFSRNNTTEKI
jgi:hypothetical protein